jgi:hypothetical protein
VACCVTVHLGRYVRMFQKRRNYVTFDASFA